MSYQVFARKYRPKTFADVLGQDHVVQTLRNAIDQNRIAHAYLFVGPRGTGKTSTARIFAKALNCPDGPKIDFDPDNELCIEIAEGRSLDVIEIDGASNNGVEQVRELRDSANYAPSRARFKIYYIDEVHMLSNAAFNALLKTLEEPPPHVKFIFATTEVQKILPTIISRCQRFDLRPIPTDTIAKHLQHIASEENVKLDDAAAWAIAKGADGGMRDAQSMMDQLVAFCGETITEANVLDIFGFTSREIVANLTLAILEQRTNDALTIIRQQAESGKDLTQLLAELIAIVRALLISQVDQNTDSEGIAAEHWSKLTALSAGIATDRMLNLIDILAESDSRMKWASNKKLYVEIAIIKCVQSLSEIRINDIIKVISGAESYLSNKNITEAASAKKNIRNEAEPVAKIEEAISANDTREEEPSFDNADQDSLSPEDHSPAPESALAPEQPKEKKADPITDPHKLWEALLEYLEKNRPMVADMARSGQQPDLSNNTFTVGFPISEDFTRDTLMRGNVREVIETFLEENYGSPLKLNIDLRADIELNESTEPEEERPLMPSEVAAQKAATNSPPAKSEPAHQAAKKPELKARQNDDEDITPSADEDFYNDPLIQKALEIFEGTLKK